MHTYKQHFAKYSLFVLLGLLSALGNMGVIYTINQFVVGYVSGSGLGSHKYVILFPCALLVFFVSRWIVSLSIITFTQGLLRKTRLEILDIVLRSSYQPLMKRKEQIYTSMTRDAGNIVNASVNMVDILTNIIVIIICFIYMSVLSWKITLCMLGLLFFTLLLYTYGEKKARSQFNTAMSYDDRFVKYLGEILNGFKEIVLERKKGEDIRKKHINDAIDKGIFYNRKALVYYLNNRIIGQIAFYAFIGSLLLFLGEWMGIEKKAIVSFIFLLLYVWGPIETVVVLMPNLAQANTSLKRIRELEQAMKVNKAPADLPAAICSYDRLEIRALRYSYPGEDADSTFNVGPIDFDLQVGEVVFIYGGNGSGKTTFIYLLTGVIPNAGGEIFMDGKLVGPEQMAAYRKLFSPVFSDFHLFDECYGIDTVDPATVQFYLSLFELDKKVSFDGNKFTTTSLSAGQRKRLALICAIFEEKPILVLDEFAADQDPSFKRKFYCEILGILREKGFTVVAITHDDNYYMHCDKIYAMNYGRIQQLNTPAMDEYGLLQIIS